jgi:predicted nucleotidyltransferase
MNPGETRWESAENSGRDMVEKSVYAKVQSPLLKWLLGNKPGVLMSHWLFQGMLYMDKTERIFKLGLDFFLLLLFYPLLRRRLPIRTSLVTGAIAAHTLNFFFNGHLWGALKHFGGITRTAQEFDAEVERLRRRVQDEPSIVFAAAYGSLARDEWTPTSDLDVRLVRAPGLRNGWRASLFTMQERSRALIKGFPLDIFVFDGEASLSKLAERQSPVILTGYEVRRQRGSDSLESRGI